MKEIQLTNKCEDALYDDILGYYKITKEGLDDVVIIKNYKYKKLQINNSYLLDNSCKMCVVEEENCENYIVQPFDTLTSISLKYGVNENYLIEKNKLKNSKIFVGQILKI